MGSNYEKILYGQQQQQQQKIGIFHKFHLRNEQKRNMKKNTENNVIGDVEANLFEFQMQIRTQ